MKALPFAIDQRKKEMMPGEDRHRWGRRQRHLIVFRFYYVYFIV